MDLRLPKLHESESLRILALSPPALLGFGVWVSMGPGEYFPLNSFHVDGVS